LIYTAILMAWAEGACLTDRFAAARAALRGMFPRWRAVGKTYQGFIKALLAEGAAAREAVARRLRQRMVERRPCWVVQGILAFAVDGSRVECPRTAANQRELKCAGRRKTGPQLSLTTVYHMGSGCPWDFRIGPGTDSERTHLRAMLATLPAGSVLVADAGFVGYDLLRDILARGLHVLFRAGANVHLLRELGYVQVENDGTVYLWPQKAQKDRRPPVVLRRIAWQGRRGPLTVVTDLSEEELSLEQAASLYAMRWGVEVFFRSLKQTLCRRKMRSAAPRQARAELTWAMMGLWVLSLQGAEALVAAGKTPHGLSIALALRQARRGMLGRLRPGRRLENLLAAAVGDGYVRRGSKQARDWPHKKNDNPPGEPKILTATPEQRQRANELAAQSAAA
jgi:hypothetical protein